MDPYDRTECPLCGGETAPFVVRAPSLHRAGKMHAQQYCTPTGPTGFTPTGVRARRSSRGKGVGDPRDRGCRESGDRTRAIT